MLGEEVFYHASEHANLMSRVYIIRLPVVGCAAVNFWPYVAYSCKLCVNGQHECDSLVHVQYKYTADL